MAYDICNYQDMDNEYVIPYVKRAIIPFFKFICIVSLLYVDLSTFISQSSRLPIYYVSY